MGVWGEEVTVLVCPWIDCCDGEALNNTMQVAFPVCCGTPHLKGPGMGRG